jgi:phage anti-repressor protein
MANNKATESELGNMLLDVFDTEEQQQFVRHFELYLQYGTDREQFVIDLDDVWKWIGFSTKGNAKKHMLKYYKKDSDYTVEKLLIQLDKQTEQIKYGLNKEKIMLNVDTFKAFCMTANTEKGKQTRQYYTKMESIFFRYMESKNRDIITRLQTEHKRKLEQERQENLKHAYKDTPCVYLFKMSETDDKNIVVKLGETDDIAQRIMTLRQEHKNCILTDVFPCNRPHKFEQYLLNRPDIKSQRLPGTECIQITPEFTYKNLVKVIEKHVGYFTNASFQETLELNRLKLKESISHEMTLLLQTISTCTDDDMKQLFTQRYKELLQQQNVCSNDVTTDNIIDKPVTTDRRVFNYAPSDLTNPVAEYFSLREAARSLNDPKTHDYHIRNASMDNTLYGGYRWYYVDDDENKPDNIPATHEHQASPSHRKGLIAQLDKDKTKILNVFPNQNAAAACLKVKACSITTALTRASVCGGYYWKMYDDCDNDLKSTYREHVPNPVTTRTSSKAVQRIHPETEEVLEEYSCIQTICSKFRTSHKTIHKVCKTGDIFKGFKWRVCTT